MTYIQCMHVCVWCMSTLCVSAHTHTHTHTQWHMHIHYTNQMKWNNWSCFTLPPPGNHYGTPKPPKEPTAPLVRRSNSSATGLPGGQSRFPPQRKRTQSGSELPLDTFEDEYVQPFTRKKSLERAHSASNLGPLPPNWEMAFTEDGHPYFIEWVHSFFFCLKMKCLRPATELKKERDNLNLDSKTFILKDGCIGPFWPI